MEPGLEVRARCESIGKPHGLHVRVLHEVFCVGGPYRLFTCRSASALSDVSLSRAIPFPPDTSPGLVRAPIRYNTSVCDRYFPAVPSRSRSRTRWVTPTPHFLKKTQACSLLLGDPYVSRNAARRDASLVECSATFATGRMSVRCDKEYAPAVPVSFVVTSPESRDSRLTRCPERAIRRGRRDASPRADGPAGRREVLS